MKMTRAGEKKGYTSSSRETCFVYVTLSVVPEDLVPLPRVSATIIIIRIAAPTTHTHGSTNDVVVSVVICVLLEVVLLVAAES